MKVSLKSVGPCRQMMKIEVPAESVAAERAELLKYYTQGVALPGFRKGRAPQALVEKKFAKDILSDLKERVVPKFYHDAVEKEGLKVVAVVDVSEPEVTDGQPLCFDVTIDVPPEFKLPKYEGISIKAGKTDVEEKEVDAALQSLRRRYATYEDVAGRAAQEGDMVQVSYEATIGGQPLEEKVPQARGMGRGTGYWITCDEESFLPGMGKALIGTRTGDRKDVTVKFPDGFIVKELVGLKAEFKVEVTGMREIKLPELNEAFLKPMQVASVEELRESIRRNLEEHAQEQEQARRQDEVCEHLLAKTKLDIPQSAVQDQLRQVMYELARQRMMGGMSRAQIDEQREEMVKEAQTRAEEQVRLRYIIMAIAEAEKVQTDEAEMTAEIASLAVQQRRDAAEYRKELEKAGNLGQVHDQILFKKTVDLLLSKAKIK